MTHTAGASIGSKRVMSGFALLTRLSAHIFGTATNSTKRRPNWLMNSLMVKSLQPTYHRWLAFGIKVHGGSFAGIGDCMPTRNLLGVQSLRSGSK